MKKVILSTIVTAILLNAQDINKLDDLSLEELMNIKIYSATKDYRSIKDIPANITIITKQDIEKYGYPTLADLLKNVPGLFVLDDTENFQIGTRGSYGSSFQLMLNNNPIFIQRLPVESTSNRNFFAIPIESIDRIEIVKGPQAVTYGSNSMYGSINIITNDFNEPNSVSFGVGDNNQRKAFARLNHSYEDGGFTLNTSFYNTDGIKGDLKDGFNQNYFASKDDESLKKVDGILTNRYKTLEFSNLYKNLTLDGFFSQTNYGLYIEPQYRDGTQIKQNENVISATYNDEIGKNLSYKLNLSHIEKDYKIVDVAINKNYIPYLYRNLVGYSRNQVDFHINYKINDNAKILVGYNYEKPNASIRGMTYKLNYNFPTKDIYSKIHLLFDDKYEFNIGKRSLKKDKYKIQYQKDTNLDGILDTTRYIDIDKKSKILPEFSAVYHIDSNNHLKFLYGKANQLTYQSMEDYEDITTREINYTFLSQYFYFNGALFKNFTNNISLFQQLTGDEYATLIKGSAENKGIELAGNYKPNNNFEISSSFSYQKNTNLADENIESSFSPKYLGKISTSYQLENTRWTAWINYISSMKASRNDETGELLGEDTKPNVTLNLNINHNVSKHNKVSLSISNILDRDNRIAAGGTLLEFEKGFYTQGQSFILSYGYKF